MRFILILLIAFFTATPLTYADESLPSPDWRRDWSPAIFEEAKRDGKLVLLNMEAIWCHWCHVMDQETYAKQDIIDLLNENYTTIKINQDSHPELSLRYRRWGWPATIIFNAEGKELQKLSGYIPAKNFGIILQAYVDNPNAPEIGIDEIRPAPEGVLAEEQRSRIMQSYNRIYDKSNGGWGNIHRFIIGPPEEYTLNIAHEGNALFKERAIKTLNGALNLIDPVWGGAYQYSDELDWLSPHYEKITFTQREFLSSFVNGYHIFKDPAYKQAADDIYRYLTDFMLSPDGTFYTSQNADLTQDITGKDFYKLNDLDRRNLGIPYIDTSIYTKNNGWIIEAIADYYTLTGDEETLKTATTAAEWMIRNHRLRGNGFIYHRNDIKGRYLAGNLAMARGFLRLYQVTGDRKWLKEAEKTADYLTRTFTDKENGGFFTSVLPEGSIFDKPYKDQRENVRAVRFLNLLSHYSGKDTFKDQATEAMKYLASPQLIRRQPFSVGIVLADEELKASPAHVVVVGSKSDEAARTLFMTSQTLPGNYKQIEWYDRAEGKLPGVGGIIEYPELPEAAAFICANGQCSPPVTNPDEIALTLANFQ